jgi:hypothetical protein
MLKQLRNKKLEEISAARVWKAFLRRGNDLPHRFSWNLPTAESVQNRGKLSRYRDKHAGKRCFIIANGPSLRQMDLRLLKDEITIGMNRIYLMKGINGFMPNYLVVSDIETQLKQFTGELDGLDAVRFFNWNARGLFTPSDNLMFFKESFVPEFQPDFYKPVGTGKSVTYICLQLAFFMGFRRVILIGKDHHYRISGIPHDSIRSDGAEENHFIKGYYSKGMKWDIPDYVGEEYSYRLAREGFEKSGGEVLDATIDGRLNIFRKIKWEDVFA